MSFFKNFAKKKTHQIATGISPKLDFVTYLLAYLLTLTTYFSYNFNQNEQKKINQINNKFVYKSCLSIR